MNPEPNPAPRLAGIARSWWQDLQEPDGRGDRAALARCNSTTEARFQPAWHTLLGRVETALGVLSPRQRQQLAVVACVLAHVRTHRDGPVAAAMVTPEKRALVSDLRFRRLLALDEAEELRRGMVRAVHLLDRSTDVGALASSLFFWGDKQRLAWAEAYYAVAPRSVSKS